MNKRKFLQMIGCLPFMGVAAKSLNGMELVTDQETIRRLGWISTAHTRWRWVAAPVEFGEMPQSLKHLIERDLNAKRT